MPDVSAIYNDSEYDRSLTASEVAGGDLIGGIVDVDDTHDSPNGTSKVIPINELFGDAGNIGQLGTSGSPEFAGIKAPVSPGATYFVAASDAPQHIKDQASILNDGTKLVCDGTGDQEQINDALTESGGHVRLSQGQFSVSPRSGETDVTGTGDLSSADPGVLSNLSFSTGSLSDISVGDLLHITGGDYGGDTLEDREEDRLAEVDSVGGSTITLSSRIWDGPYSNVTFHRIKPCIYMPQQRRLEGAGPIGTTKGTSIKIADGVSHASAIGNHADAIAKHALQICNMEIGGNKTNTTDTHGIALNSVFKDVHLLEVSSWNNDGYGIHISRGWGFNWRGGWAEFNTKGGIVILGPPQARLCAVKTSDNGGPAVKFIDTDSPKICGGSFIGTGSGEFGVVAIWTPKITITGSWIGPHPAHSDPLAIRLGAYCNNAVITGNWIEGKVGALKPNGVSPTTYTYNTIFRDNHHSGTNTFNNTARARMSASMGGNSPQNILDVTDLVQAENNSGGSIAELSVVVFENTATMDTYTTTTTKGDEAVAGILRVGSAQPDGTESYIQTCGKAPIRFMDSSAVSIGDYLTTSTTTGCAVKATSGDLAFAKALEATDGGGGEEQIDALLIHPRRV